MNAELRERIRQARSARALRIMELDRRMFKTLFCSHCGGPIDDYTPACSTCVDRLRARRARGQISETQFLEAKEIIDRWHVAVLHAQPSWDHYGCSA